jgi:hypothetical protein
MDKGLQPQYRGQMNLSPLVLRLCPFPPPCPPPAPFRRLLLAIEREIERERERRKAKSKLALCCTSYCCLLHSAPTSHLLVLLTPDCSPLTSYFLLVACPSRLTFSLSTTELRDPMFPACGQELEACPGPQGVPTNSADPPNDMPRPIRPLPSVGLSLARSLISFLSPSSHFSLLSSRVVGVNLQSENRERERERERRGWSTTVRGLSFSVHWIFECPAHRGYRLAPKRKKRWCPSQSDLTRGDGHAGGPSECESNLMPLRHVPSDCQGPPDQYRRQTRLSGPREERERRGTERRTPRFGAFLFGSLDFRPFQPQ